MESERKKYELKADDLKDIFKDQLDNFYKDHKKKKYYQGLLNIIIKSLNLKES
jgi:nucleoside diphosphate kinase